MRGCARTDLRRARRRRSSVRRYGDRHPRAGCIGLVAHSPLHRRAPRRRHSRPAARASRSSMPCPSTTRRKLVLVRRDNVEHLILIGGPTDVVVEPSIVRQRSHSAARSSRGPTRPRRRAGAQAARTGRGARRRPPRPARRRHSPRPAAPARSSSPRPTTPYPFPPRRAPAPPPRRERPCASRSRRQPPAAPPQRQPHRRADASRLGCGRDTRRSARPSERGSRPSRTLRRGQCGATRVEQVIRSPRRADPAMPLHGGGEPPVDPSEPRARRADMMAPDDVIRRSAQSEEDLRPPASRRGQDRAGRRRRSRHRHQGQRPREGDGAAPRRDLDPPLGVNRPPRRRFRCRLLHAAIAPRKRGRP